MVFTIFNVVRLVVKNKHWRDAYQNEVAPRARISYTDTILGLIVNDAFGIHKGMFVHSN